MWYFDFEFDLFEPNGKRIEDAASDEIPDDQAEEEFMRMGQNPDPKVHFTRRCDSTLQLT